MQCCYITKTVNKENKKIKCLPTINIQWLVFFYAFLAEIRRKNEENFGRLLWKSYVLV